MHENGWTPQTVVLTDTCDAGGCERLTQAVVWVAGEAKWLSMCAKHARQELKTVRDARLMS
jgi:NADPH-dependent ferric siderophore reductase